MFFLSLVTLLLTFCFPFCRSFSYNKNMEKGSGYRGGGHEKGRARRSAIKRIFPNSSELCVANKLFKQAGVGVLTFIIIVFFSFFFWLPYNTFYFFFTTRNQYLTSFLLNWKLLIQTLRDQSPLF